MPPTVSLDFYLTNQHPDPDPITVGELRQFVEMLDSFNVSNDALIEECHILVVAPIDTSLVSITEHKSCFHAPYEYDTVIKHHHCP